MLYDPEKYLVFLSRLPLKTYEPLSTACILQDDGVMLYLNLSNFTINSNNEKK